MRIFLIFALLFVHLFAEIYQCDGIGNSKPEAQESAKQSAVASSSTYIKSEFNSDISTQSQNKSYILKTIASGIARIINGSFSRYDNQNYIFSGTCEVQNEAITKTEEILKKIKEIDYKFTSKISQIKSEYKNLQLKISSFNNNQTQQTDLKKQISQLESQINDFNSVENRIYQNINYKLQQYFTSVSKKSEYLNQKFLNLKSDLNSIDSEIDSKIENIEYQIDSLKTEIDKNRN